MATTTLRRLLAFPMRHDVITQGREGSGYTAVVASVCMHVMSSSLCDTQRFISKDPDCNVTLESPRLVRGQAGKNFGRGVSRQARYGELLARSYSRRFPVQAYCSSALLSSTTYCNPSCVALLMSITAPQSLISMFSNMVKKSLLRRCVHGGRSSHHETGPPSILLHPRG